MATSLQISLLGVLARLFQILRLQIFRLKFLKIDLVSLLQRYEDVHGFLALAGLSEIRSILHFSDHILIVVENRDQESLHDKLWSRLRVLLLVEDDLDL